MNPGELVGIYRQVAKVEETEEREIPESEFPDSDLCWVYPYLLGVSGQPCPCRFLRKPALECESLLSLWRPELAPSLSDMANGFRTRTVEQAPRSRARASSRTPDHQSVRRPPPENLGLPSRLGPQATDLVQAIATRSSPDRKRRALRSQVARLANPARTRPIDRPHQRPTIP